MTTPSGIPEIAFAATAYLTHNRGMRTLGIRQTTVLDRTLTTPPVSPGALDVYIPASVATGDWTGQEDSLARFEDGNWVFYPPYEGQIIYSEGDTDFIRYSSGSWSVFNFVVGGASGAVKVSANDLTSDFLLTKLVAGTGITLTENNDGGAETLTIDGASQLAVLDEGISLTAQASSIDFVGAAVTATNVGDAVTVTVSGGAVFATDVGDGVSNTYTINHALGTRDVYVVVYRNSAPYDEVIVGVDHTDDNNIDLDFGATTPTTNEFRVVVSPGGGGGGGGGSSPLTTKGDLYTYDTADARLPVGTDGQILSANSATGTGLEWIAAPSGGGTIATQDEGVSVDPAATTLNFVGSGVTATDAGGNVTTVSIPSSFTNNEETLTGTKTLANGDATFQVLNPNGFARDVVMPASPNNDLFFHIINDSNGLSASGNTLNLKETGAGATIVTLDDTTGLTNIRVIYTGTKFVWF